MILIDSNLFSKIRIMNSCLFKKFNTLYCKSIRKLNRNRSFTIVSNNCWGGGIYEDLNLEYCSPTVGLFFYAPCYIEFIDNLDFMLEQDLQFVSKSKYDISNKYREDNKRYYPIGVLGSIEIHFLHYNSEKDAFEKWNYRKVRIDKKNLFVKFCDRDLCNRDLINRFDALNFPKKIFFSSKKLPEIKSAIYLPAYKNDSCVGDLYNNRWTYRFRFSIIRWLNL